jgi:hypothetical protein
MSWNEWYVVSDRARLTREFGRSMAARWLKWMVDIMIAAGYWRGSSKLEASRPGTA